MKLWYSWFAIPTYILSAVLIFFAIRGSGISHPHQILDIALGIILAAKGSLLFYMIGSQKQAWQEIAAKVNMLMPYAGITVLVVCYMFVELF